MPSPGRRLQVRGWQPVESSSFERPPGVGQHQLASQNVHGVGIADVSAGNQRALPNLLGIYSAAPGLACKSADSDYTLYVPPGAGRRRYLTLSGNYLRRELLV